MLARGHCIRRQEATFKATVAKVLTFGVTELFIAPRAKADFHVLFCVFLSHVVDPVLSFF